MGFVRRAGTTGKVEIHVGAKKEVKLAFLHELVNNVEKFQIPSSLVMNLDQISSKYVSMGKATMSEKEKGSNSVGISSLSNKRSMTATFTITLNRKFLLMQLIYGGKPNKAYLNLSFPLDFSLSANAKNYSNTAESIKLFKGMIIPYIEKKILSLKLLKTQPALLIMDVFRRQMIEDVLIVLKDNNILLVRVPANMTHIFRAP